LQNLTLPGSIPGLIRPCSPVRYDDLRYVVVSLDLSTAWIARDGTVVSAQRVRLSELSLDLTDRTGRYHASLYWLRRLLRPPISTVTGTGDGRLSRMHSPAVTYLSWGELHAVAHRVARPSYLREAVVVPEFADLDPSDTTRLPDGSSVVATVGLRMVCEHLVGGVG
jgi:hypothetical protein